MGMSFKSILTLLCVCIFFSTAAFAADVFTVENIEVDVTASNAIEARNQAFAKAQITAFTNLTERLVKDGASKAIKTPDVDTISTMIKDYEVTNEKLSSVRYVGTYTFRFDEHAVGRLFKGAGQSYTATSSRPLLILPFYQKGEHTILWSPANSWMQAWSASENHNPLVPLVIPIGDLSDVRDIDDQGYKNLRGSKLSRMLARYGAGEAVIVMAAADEHLSMVDHPNQPATGHLNITVYRTDRGIAEYANQFSVPAKPDQTFSNLLATAVQQTQKMLTKDWKARTVIDPSEVNTLDVKVPIQSLTDWTDIRRALDRTSMITQIALRSFSPSAAVVALKFQGNVQRLSIALDQADLVLEREDIGLSKIDITTEFSGRPYIIRRKYQTPTNTYGANGYARTF